MFGVQHALVVALVDQKLCGFRFVDEVEELVSI